MLILKDPIESSFSSHQFVIIIHRLLKRKLCVMFSYFFILAIVSPFTLNFVNTRRLMISEFTQNF